MDIDSLLAHLPPDTCPSDRDLITRAFQRAAQVHAGQYRRSGQPYITHCVAVAQILADMKLDAVTIAAALLHDTIEDTSLTLLDLDDAFGPEVAALVDGVTKLESIPRVKDGRLVDMDKRAPARESEFLRKVFIAMSQDVRVILIKLADRLDNMRSLQFLAPARQRAIAEETMGIFAPLAHRLGIWKMKCELEDLSFRYLQPERYHEIDSALEQHRESAETHFRQIARRIERSLAQVGLPVRVVRGRRHVYDIYRRAQRKNTPPEHLYDLLPIRVIVEDRLACYLALGVIHSLWRPVDGEFDDYIAHPKDNFYKSLHTTVITQDKRTLTIQLRTQEMHEQAEYGIVAHWRYQNGADADEAFEQRIQYLRNLLDVEYDNDDADEYIDALRSDVFQDRVYVFTPQSDVIDLPVGATPIDFAYHIHTQVGHRSRGARVNDKLVPLDYHLQTGDKVEIITANRGGPKVDWLNPSLGYVKTKRAMTKIRQWFRRQSSEQARALGQEVISRELRRLGAHTVSMDELAALFARPTDEFLAAVGMGEIDSRDIAIHVLEAERKTHPSVVIPTPPEVVGTNDMAVRCATCCAPQEGQPIMGHCRRAEGELIIHRADCPTLGSINEDDLVNLSWRAPTPPRHLIPVVITAYDREGLMRDIGAVVANERVNMTSVNITTHNNIATFTATMEIPDYAQLSRVLAKVEQLANVIEAHRQTTPIDQPAQANHDSTSQS